MYGGAIGGFSEHPHQQMYFRKFSKVIDACVCVRSANDDNCIQNITNVSLTVHVVVLIYE